MAKLSGQYLSPLRAFYLVTLGAARCLGLDERIGTLTPGSEADFVVLDLAATSLLARRLPSSATLTEKLRVLMTLGDERAVQSTYAAGKLIHSRDTAVLPRVHGALI